MIGTSTIVVLRRPALTSPECGYLYDVAQSEKLERLFHAAMHLEQMVHSMYSQCDRWLCWPATLPGLKSFPENSCVLMQPPQGPGGTSPCKRIGFRALLAPPRLDCPYLNQLHLLRIYMLPQVLEAILHPASVTDGSAGPFPVLDLSSLPASSAAGAAAAGAKPEAIVARLREAGILVPSGG